MNKLIIAVVIIIIAAVAILMLPIPVTRDTGTSDTGAIQESGEQEIVDESYLLEDLYISMLEEEMDSLEIEQTEYNTEIEDQIASDMSQFYY